MMYNDRFNLYKENGVAVFKSSNISSSHAFSTRLGGVSTDPYLSSLNLNYDRGDIDENVAENLRIFTKVLGSDPEHLVSASQIHSTDIRIVDMSDAGTHFSGVDGFITSERGVVISISVADCTPILMEDRQCGVIAALHAGWRGTVAGIAEKGVNMMTSLGCHSENIQVAIGPCIHSCCYEVGEDFYDNVSCARGKRFADKYVIRDKNLVLRADITSMNAEILLDAGILPENISISSRCTCCDRELFFSHRASKGHRGTMKAAIVL